MTFTLTKRRVLAGLAALAAVVLIAGLLARQALTGLAVSVLLQLAGASDIRFTVTAASPWRVVVEDIGFQVRGQAFAAKHISFTRAHWWSPTLGVVRVQQAQVPVALDDKGVVTLPIPGAESAGAKPAAPASVPVEEIFVDGQVLVKVKALPEQALAVKLEARPGSGNQWSGRYQVGAPGLSLEGEGSYDLAKGDLAFKVPAISLDVKTWQAFAEQLVPMPGGPWEIEGKLTARAEGRLMGRDLVATAHVQLREGRVLNADQKLAAEGVEADLEFTDLAEFVTKPGTMRLRELRVGQLALQEVDYEFAFQGTDRVGFTRVNLKTLGGTVSAEPFSYLFSRGELEAVVLVDGIDVAAVMALTRDLPAKAIGRVNGRFPIRIDDSGLRLGTGWLQLKPGVHAEIQFDANGLLTGGASPNNPAYAVLKKVESGLLKLKVSELRLDIRPPNAPPGRSAQLHIAGEPVDPDVKAPVVLDLNVNGPLEKLINLGLDSRLSFGSKE